MADDHREDHHVAAENPFDANGECTYCDEQAMHRADCPWLGELLRENARLRARLEPVQGLLAAKYLNPFCAEKGCQWLTARSE